MFISQLFSQKYNKDYINNCTLFHNSNKSQFVLFSYKDKKVQKLIISIKKYRDSKRDKVVSERLNLGLHSLLNDYIHEPLIIPVPISKETMSKRGFNQILNIAKELVKMNQNIKLGDKIVKKRDTKKQAYLKRKERIKNTASAFYLEKMPKQKLIIILDDVITTGSTMKAIESLLPNDVVVIRLAVAA